MSNYADFVRKETKRLRDLGLFDDVAEATYKDAILAALREEAVFEFDELSDAKSGELRNLSTGLWPAAVDHYATAQSWRRLTQTASDEEKGRSLAHLLREQTDEAKAFMIAEESARLQAEAERIDDID